VPACPDACRAKCLEFPAGQTAKPSFGLALNLERDSVGSVILGSYEHISEGDTVKCTAASWKCRSAPN
jgi:F-type H+-transporting ATPase subunit alpha